MKPKLSLVRPHIEERAKKSEGKSSTPVYRMVGSVLEEKRIHGGVFVDLGCGRGDLQPFVGSRFARYIGVDAVQYEGLPADVEYLKADLDSGHIDLPSDTADIVAAVELIEHLENPRALVREMARLAKPGGWILITTPNQLSLLSKMTLVTKNCFNAFQEGDYPAHLTALLEIDLRRIASEAHLEDLSIVYSGSGRVALTAWHWPAFLSKARPRELSDNVLLLGKKGRQRR